MNKLRNRWMLSLRTVVFILISWVTIPAQAGYLLDFPHTTVNNIDCFNCHNVLGGMEKFFNVVMPDPPQNLDDTPANNLCWSCHNDVVAPFMKTHSSITIDNDYGDWAIECRTCHEPHYHYQLATHGEEAHLTSGVITEVTETTLRSAGANWVDDEFAKLVLLIRSVGGYRIVSNTHDTLTLKGPVELDKVSPGDNFVVIYGKLVRSKINTPNSGPKPVKLFRPVGPNTFADGDDIYDGPCEVCHTKTRHHRNNDDNPDQADHTHNVGIKCTLCHKHKNGFLPMGAGAHDIHLTQTFGPKITCGEGAWGCHGAIEPGSNYPNEVYFADGKTLCDGRPNTACPNTGPDTGTQVCANCHGEGAGLAKYYFFRPGSSQGEAGVKVTDYSGEYTWADTWLGELGEQKFCGSCHNDTANPIPVVGPGSIGEPPNIVGDLDIATGENTYGFFVNGHGKESDQNYARLSWQDDAAKGNPGAGRVCSDCHDYLKGHWNTGGTKRLKDGFENDNDNTVCRKCHNNEGGPVYANNDPEWYRSDDYTNFKNSAHGPGIPGDKGNLKCTMCHDPHGAVKQDLTGNGALNPAMTKGYQQELCYRCHSDNGDLMQVKNHQIANNRPGGYVSADDIEEAFTLADGHDLGTAFTNSGKNYKLECVSCHNVHVVTGRYWDAEQNLSPIALPLGGFDVWGDDPEEKMDYYAATGSGTGGFYWQIANGKQLGDTGMIWNAGGMYQPPKSGGGLNFEFAGDKLPAYPKFCLTCHTERVSSANPPVNWGQGIGCTDNSVDPPNQRVECGARHGFGLAGTPFNKNEDNPSTSGNWGTSGNPDAIFKMNYVTRGRGGGHFMRWPYDSANRNSGANYVLSCTDCHEAHRANRSSMIRERFQVTANGDCGSGGDATPETAGENCRDGTLWNSFCNACHYYYGGHHAGMSCGNASCHEVNSIHRIIHSGADSGGGTRLEITSTKTDPNDGIPYREDFQPPTFTPEIERVGAQVGSDQLMVYFRPSQQGAGTAGIYGSVDVTDLTVDTLSGALDPKDFWLIDKGGNNPRTITGVSHTPGALTATLTMSAPLTAADLNTDTLSAQPTSIWGWYEGGYNNFATGVVGPQVVSAGPWPVAITEPPPILQAALYGGPELKLNGIVNDSNQIFIAFAEGAYANPDASGNLQADDFVLNCGGRDISSVAHTAGDSFAVLTLSTIVNQSEIGVCTVAAAPGAVYRSYGIPAGTDAITLALPPVASVNDLVLSWDFNEGSGTVTESTDALGTQEDMHGVLTRNVVRVASTKPGAIAGDNAVKLDRVSDRGAVQLNYPVNPDDGFPPATYRSGGVPVIVQEMQQADKFSFSAWIKPTALGCQEGQDLGLNTKLRRDILTTQFWIKNWALGIMRFSDDGDPINGNCTDEDSGHDVLRFWIAVGDPTDLRCDAWGGSWPEYVHPVNPVGYMQGNTLMPTDQAVCNNSAFPTLPTNKQAHSFAQTETLASGALTYGGTALQPGVWQHVVGTWDGRYIRIYIDGQMAAETDMGGSGNYVMVSDPHLWGGDLVGDGSVFRHVSSFFAAGARPIFSTTGSPSGGAAYWNTNGFYDLNSSTYVGELDDVRYWKRALPLTTIQQ